MSAEQPLASDGKRELASSSSPPPAKRAKPSGPSSPVTAAQPQLSGDAWDDLDALIGGESFDEESAPPLSSDESQRAEFANRLAVAKKIDAEDLPGLLETLRDKAPSWGDLRRGRSVALLLVYISRSGRQCRAAFAAEGMPMLGACLTEGVNGLEQGSDAERQEAGMRIEACLVCLKSLPIGRATMWEHRHSVGKPFDRLHRWCAKSKSALAAGIRVPTNSLCAKWRRQPKPAEQDGDAQQKAIRKKVVSILGQGLSGFVGNSPASPAPYAMSPSVGCASPGMLPPSTTAAELEAALFAFHNGASKGVTDEYRRHARTLRNNIGKNADLRNQVLGGEITMEQLCAMSTDDLAPEGLKEYRRTEAAKMLNEVWDKDGVALPLPRTDSNEGYDRNLAPPPLRLKGIVEQSVDESSDKGASSSEPKRLEVFRMEPPPTPFGDGLAPQHPAMPMGAAMASPFVEATPAPGEEDEDAEALIRYLSNSIL